MFGGVWWFLWCVVYVYLMVELYVFVGLGDFELDDEDVVVGVDVGGGVWWFVV